MKRIALLNFGGIGDEILFSPVIHAVHQAYPEAELTLILEHRSRSVHELLPEVSHLETVDLGTTSRGKLFGVLLKRLRAGRFDAVISSGSSPFIPVLLSCSGIRVRVGFETGAISRFLLTGAAPLDRKTYAGDMYYSLAKTFLSVMQKDPLDSGQAIPKLSVEQEAQERAQLILSEFEKTAPRQRILIHPGVSHMSVVKNILKAWPLEHWQALITELTSRYPDAHLYLMGGPDDAEVINTLEAHRRTLPQALASRVFNFYGKTSSLKDLAAFISVADVLISVDSAPMHLAIGLGTPVAAIFSPTDPQKLVPQSPQVEIAFREDLNCRPCLWDVRKVSCDNPVCLDVPVELVLTKVDKLLRQKISAF